MEEVEEYQKPLSDYVHLFLRRKFYFLSTVFMILIIGASVVFFLPAKYDSKATILIESQQIPSDLIRSTITSIADERIEIIKQKVLITSKISEIIDKYKLYTTEKQEMTISALTDLFRKNVEIKMISANRGRRGRTANIAFTLSFTDKNPNVAQVVANELVTLFLAENVKTRTLRAEETTDFLAEEAKKIKKSIGDIENKLSEFKSQNTESLPEYMALNLKKMERYETSYQNNLSKIEALKSKTAFLESELRLMSSEGSGPTTADIIEQMEIKLRDLRLQFTDVHPDVVTLQNQIESLRRSDQNKVNMSLKSSVSSSKVKKRMNNAAYIEVRAQLNASRSELNQLVQAAKRVQEQLNETEQRILKAPDVEKVYKEFLRDYDNMQNKYREIKNKELEARISQNLEIEKKGERFTLLEPALYPDKASKPNRPKLLMMVIAAAGLLGVVVVFGVESLNPAVRGEREVENVIGELPLVIIPYIQTDEDIRKNKIRIKLVVGILLALGAVALLVIHFFFMQLDVLWYTLLRKASEF